MPGHPPAPRPPRHPAPTRRLGFSRRERGLTLLEVVVVIVLLGVLAAVALPRITEGSFRAAAFAEQVAAALRYAQRLAVASGCEIEVQVDAAAGRYAVRRRADGSDTRCGTTGPFTLDVPNPAGGGAFAGVATGGVAITQGLTIRFDAQGLPSPNGGSVVVGGRTITVESETGHVR